MTAGYSGTPLVKKLGIKRGNRVALLQAPEHYLDLLGELPPALEIDFELANGEYDFIQAFYQWRADYEADFDQIEVGDRQRRHGLDFLVQESGQDADRYHGGCGA